jgi:hypothetical protein
MASGQRHHQSPPPLASLDRDFWCLRSAEASHQAAPETFLIPSHAERDGLARGDAVKLIFDQEGYEEDGSVAVHGERMWVLVTERIGGRYLGVLDSNPQLFEADDHVYLRKGAEIAFDAEHVIDIGHPPADYVAERLSQAPTRRWARESRGCVDFG